MKDNEKYYLTNSDVSMLGIDGAKGKSGLMQMTDGSDPDQGEYIATIDASKKVETLPDIKTEEGKKLAIKFALKLDLGEISENNVPAKYRNFVHSLQNQWHTSDKISEFGTKYAFPVLLTAATTPMAIAGAGVSAASIGVIPTLAAETGGIAGGYYGSIGGAKLGQHIDQKYGTNTTPWLSLAGGLVGGVAGGYGGLKGGQLTVKAGKKAADVAENAVNDVIIYKAKKDGRLEFIDEPTTYTGYHQSNSEIYEPDFNFERWDVVNHGADKKGMFFTEGSPADSGFLSKRKFTSQWDIGSNKTFVQHGEIKGLFGGKNNIRNRIVSHGRKNGADVVLFDGIADNQLQNQRIIFATDNAKFNLKNHNYYDRLKPISDLDRANIMTGTDLQKSFQKVSRKYPKSLKEYARSVVADDGSVDVEKYKKVNEEIYKFFDQTNVPYRKMEDVTGQRYFLDGKVLRDGNLYDHSLGTVQSGLSMPLPKVTGRPITRKEMALLDLYHDQGKLITYINDNVAKHKFPMHDEYGYYMGNFYGIDQRGKNAIRGHMGDKGKGINSALQSHDRLTGATAEQGKSFVQNYNKWIPYLDENYVPVGIATSERDLARSAQRIANATHNSTKNFRPGFEKEEMTARGLQDLDVRKEIADVAKIIQEKNPELYAQLSQHVDNPFAVKNLGKTYQTISGNPIDKIATLWTGYKQFRKTNLPILNGEYHGNINDFLTLSRADKLGLTPTTRFVAGSDKGKMLLFTGGDNTGAPISYGLKTKTPQGKGTTYVGKLTLNEARLPVTKQMKDDLMKSYNEFVESSKRLKSGTSTNVVEDLKIMLQNYSALENSSLATDVMRGSSVGKYETSFQKATIHDLSDFAKSKIDYAHKASDKISFRDAETSHLYTSKPIDTENGPVTNQFTRYFIKKDTDILDLAQMNNYGLQKWKDLDNRKALLHSLLPKKDQYPTLWKLLNESGRVSTDDIAKAALKDNPNVAIRFKNNDFGGRTVKGEFPIEIIGKQQNMFTNDQVTAQTRHMFDQMRQLSIKFPKIDVQTPMVGGTTITLQNTINKNKAPK